MIIAFRVTTETLNWLNGGRVSIPFGNDLDLAPRVKPTAPPPAAKGKGKRV